MYSYSIELEDPSSNEIEAFTTTQASFANAASEAYSRRAAKGTEWIINSIILNRDMSQLQSYDLYDTGFTCEQ